MPANADGYGFFVLDGMGELARELAKVSSDQDVGQAGEKMTKGRAAVRGCGKPESATLLPRSESEVVLTLERSMGGNLRMCEHPIYNVE